VAVTALAPDDGRPVFSVPHPEGTLVGTTDLFHSGPLDDPRPSVEEAAYLLRFAKRIFPAARLRAQDVSGAFAGVRPVLSSHAETPSEASREEAVWEERGLVSTAGGKLTTFRATAEKVVNTTVKLLPEERRDGLAPPQTAAVALPWRGDHLELVRSLRSLRVGEEVAQGLVRRLGALALPAVAADHEALRPVAEGLDLCGAELVWQLRFGGVVHLEDLLLRRVRLGMWQPRLCLEIAPKLRPLLRRAAGWTVARWNAELKRLERAVFNWLPPEAT
jgi:glycerol-3-phosphate dehydrogenase